MGNVNVCLWNSKFRSMQSGKPQKGENEHSRDSGRVRIVSEPDSHVSFKKEIKSDIPFHPSTAATLASRSVSWINGQTD